MRLIRSSNEEQIIKGCLKGKPLAQKELYSKYASKMMGVCRNYTKNKEEAEEVLINGFVKVFKKIGTYNGTGSFEGWIRRIMVNESLNFIKIKRRLYVEVDIEEIGDEPNIDLISNNLEEEEIHKMVDELPTGYRTVFNLYVVEGFTHKEIAEMLEVTESTSKSQLAKAKKLLQHKLVVAEQYINLGNGQNG